MIRLNEHYLDLEESYLFTNIAEKVRAYQEANPEAKIIRLGIGDVTLPLVKPVIDALHQAVEEQANASSFRGYGPEQGYEFLRARIAEKDFQSRGIRIDAEEIFISDGAKSDMGNFLDVLGKNLTVLVADPVYPVYVDTNIMHGNTIVKLPCTKENNFIPSPPAQDADLIYLCSPNNPLGVAMDRDALQAWVDYAKEKNALILFDAAYEAFIQEDIVHSIYEIEGADEVAVEIRSFSKLAGFTGLRCGYTVIPKKLVLKDEQGNPHTLWPLWRRRQTTKYNGVPYIVQRAAEAVYSDEGYAACMENIQYYLKNASLLKEALSELGMEVFGGTNAPYVWVKTPNNMTSWEYFDYLLETHHLVTTPGSGFGDCGEGYIRLSSFGSREATLEAIERLQKE